MIERIIIPFYRFIYSAINERSSAFVLFLCMNFYGVIIYGAGILKIMDAYEGTGLTPQIETSDNAFKIILPARRQVDGCCGK